VPETEPLVRYEPEDGIAVVTLNRPPVNALSRPLWLALLEALDKAGDDETIKCIILTASGDRVFSGGADINEFLGISQDEDARRERARFLTSAFTRVARAALPVICAINGTAVGGGVAITSLCDYRIAAEHALFGMPEIDRGTVAAGGSTFMRLGVPNGTIREMILTGRKLSAHEALAAHFVDKVVPADQLMPAAMELARQISSKARLALVLTKRSICDAELVTNNWLKAYEDSMELGIQLRGSKEGIEGARAFLEKRSASFT
jgi:enoyl-CoA hydratase